MVADARKVNLGLGLFGRSESKIRELINKLLVLN